MRTTFRFAVAGALVLALSAPAWGKDVCIDFDVFTIVAQNFTLPGKGKCKPLVGVFGVRSAPGADDLTSEGDVVSGTVCTNSAKTALRIGFTVHPGSLGNGDTGGRTYFGQANVPLPELANGGTALRFIGDDGTIVSSQSLVLLTSVRPCPLPDLPIP
jgi:hypothetical protein